MYTSSKLSSNSSNHLVFCLLPSASLSLLTATTAAVIREFQVWSALSHIGWRMSAIVPGEVLLCKFTERVSKDAVLEP